MVLNKQDLLKAIEAETDQAQLGLLRIKLDVIQNLLDSNYRTLETLTRAKTFTSDLELITYLDGEIKKIKAEIVNLTGSSTTT